MAHTVWAVFGPVSVQDNSGQGRPRIPAFDNIKFCIIDCSIFHWWIKLILTIHIFCCYLFCLFTNFNQLVSSDWIFPRGTFMRTDWNQAADWELMNKFHYIFVIVSRCNNKSWLLLVIRIVSYKWLEIGSHSEKSFEPNSTMIIQRNPCQGFSGPVNDFLSVSI